MNFAEGTMNAKLMMGKNMQRSTPYPARWAFALMALVATSLCACVAGVDSGTQSGNEDIELGRTAAAQATSRPPIPVVPALTSMWKLPPGFTNAQIVGLMRAHEECPKENADWARIEGLERPGLLHRDGNHFCGFRWRHVEKTPDPATAPAYCPRNHGCCNGTATCSGVPHPGTSWLEPDDGGVYASALPPEANQIIADAVRTQHRAAMGTPAVFPKGKRAFTDLPRKIKVYVLDNSSEDEPGIHGDTVASWIKQTACPDGDCGLWIQKRKVIEADGKGDVLKLAQAIMDAVDDAGTWPALINLSLQVHPLRVFEPNRNPWAGNDVSIHLFRFPHQALELALNYARCHGVVVVAAAGNRDGGSDPFLGNGIWGKNIAYPAAYSETMMATPWACPGETGPVTGQLVVAVGGIQADGSDAPSKREKGQACLVAPSVALTPDGGPLEGTSFSAAAMTGAIAGVWRYAPFARGYDVVGMLQQSAQVIPRGPRSRGCNASSINNDNGYADAKRVNLCKGMKAALTATCNEASANPARAIYSFACDMHTQLSCTNIAVDALANISPGQGTVLAGTANSLALNRHFVSGMSSVPQPGACGGALFADGQYRNYQSCPEQVANNGTILANGPGTSPGGIGCLGCSVARLSNNSLWFFGSLYSGQITSPTLNLGLSGVGGNAQFVLLSAGTVERSYELGEVIDERGPGYSFAVLIDENVSQDQLLEASFAYRMVDEGVETAHVAGLPMIEVN